MTNTTKYILIGGAALVGVVLISKRMAASQAAASKPTGVAGAIAGATQVYDSLKAVSWGRSLDVTRTLDPTGLPYGPGASDGTAAVSDATGTRQLKAQIPAQIQFYDSRLAGLKS